MKRLLFFMLVIAITVGCGQIPVDPPSETEHIPEPNAVGPALAPDNEHKITSTSTAKEFVFSSLVYFNDGWVYYAMGGSRELRKCKPDLSQDQIVFSNGFGGMFIVNPDGYLVEQSIGVREGEYYIGHIHNGSPVLIDLPLSEHSNITRYKNIILYKDNIYLIDVYDKHIYNYDLKGNYKKTIYDGKTDSFGVVDDALLFLTTEKIKEESGYSNAILRYSLTSGTTETVFKFDIYEIPWVKGEYFTPRVNYDGRNIVVINNMTLLYTDIDMIELKEVDLNFVETQWDYPEYVNSNEDDLYLRITYLSAAGDTAPDPFDRIEYYKIVKGTAEPEYLKSFYKDHHSMYIIDGYLYYHEYEEDASNVKLLRESLY